MIKQGNFKKIYWLKNFETGENLTFPEDKVTEEQLKEYNEKGYNVYQTVNTFTGNKRQIKDLAEIRACFVDIDYAEIAEKDMSKEERAEFIKGKYEEVQANLKKIKELYKIEPSLLNLTYKGFHILFDYSEDCYFIEKSIHTEINELLNNILGGDENARDLARVYKVVGFYDWKGGKRGKIKNLVTNHSGIITKDIIEFKFNLKLKSKSKSEVLQVQETKEIKKEKFIQNLEKINSFDALEFIKELNLYFEKLKEYKKFFDFSEDEIKTILNKLKFAKTTESIFNLLEADGQTETSGLRLELTNGIWKINDYSKKTRRGNYNFLKNWILIDTKKGIDKINSILFSTINLTSNSSQKVLMDGKLMWDILNNRMDFDEHKLTQNPYSMVKAEGNQILQLSEETKETNLALQSHNNKILQNFKDNYFKVFLGLFIYIKQKIDSNQITLTQDGFYEIEWKDFLQSIYGMDKPDDIKNHKPIIKEILYGISALRIPVQQTKTLSSGKVVQTDAVTDFISVEFLAGTPGRGNKNIFLVKPFLSEKFIFSNNLGIKNMKILNHQKGFKDLYPTYFHDKIYTVLNNSKESIFIESFENCFEILHLESPELKTKLRTLKKHLEDGVENGYYQDYIIDKNKQQIKVFKFKQ